MPTHFHAKIFSAAGYPRERISVVGEPVDTEFFKVKVVYNEYKFTLHVMNAAHSHYEMIIMKSKPQGAHDKVRFRTQYLGEDYINRCVWIIPAKCLPDFLTFLYLNISDCF